MAYNPVYADACMGAAADLGAEILKLTLPFNGPLPKKAWGAALKEADLVVYSKPILCIILKRFDLRWSAGSEY